MQRIPGRCSAGIVLVHDIMIEVSHENDLKNVIMMIAIQTFGRSQDIELKSNGINRTISPSFLNHALQQLGHLIDLL